MGTVDDATSYMPYAKELLGDPVRNATLFGSYGALNHVQFTLDNQNLDPASPWFGSIRTWKNYVDKPDVRWDRWCSFDKPTLNADGWLNNLAAGYAVDAPFNLRRKDEKLLIWIALVALADLLRIYEDDTLKYGKADIDMLCLIPGLTRNTGLD